MKTIKIILLLLIFPFMLLAENSFSTNRTNVWISDGSNSKTFSVQNWSDIARLKGKGIFVNEQSVSSFRNSTLLNVLVNNIPKSYPPYSRNSRLPRLSLIGLDGANSKIGDGINKSTLSITPSGGEFNSTIEITLSLHASKGAKEQVMYKIDNQHEVSQPLSMDEGNSSIQLYLYKSGEHNISYKLENDTKFNVAYFNIVDIGDNPLKRDSDGDGIPDSVEIELGMNPLNKTIADRDNDGWNDFDELIRGTNRDTNNSKPLDSDGDGWSDWDEEELRATDKDNNHSKPTANSLYGVEYKVMSEALSRGLKKLPLSRISFVDLSSVVLYDSMRLLDINLSNEYHNIAISPIIKNDLNNSLNSGDIPQIRIPADMPIVERVQERNDHTTNSWVVKSFITSTDARTLLDYYNEFNQTVLPDNFNASMFIEGFVTYMKQNLLLNKSIILNEESSVKVALLESAFDSRVDEISTLLIGNPEFPIDATAYVNTLTSLNGELRDIDDLYIDLQAIMNSKNPSFLNTLRGKFLENNSDRNTTENTIAKFIQSSFDNDLINKYRVSLMTIISFSQAENNESVFRLDTDTDGDGLSNKDEVLPINYTHPLKVDSDSDGLLDGEDTCVNDSTNSCLNDELSLQDTDQDGVLDSVDNCPFDKNEEQEDSDNDGIGDVCAEKGIVMLTPRTNIRLFQGESFTFEAYEPLSSGEAISWYINQKNITGDKRNLTYQHYFETPGIFNICVELNGQSNPNPEHSSCVNVNVIKRKVNDVLNIIYARNLTEGDNGVKNLLVEVVLDEPLPIDKTYKYQTVAVTATKNKDYRHIVGELTFMAGEIRHYLTIPIIGDLKSENDETFKLEVGNITETITIIDDDVTPAMSRINPTISISEGTGTNHVVNFDFELDVAPKAMATLDIAPMVNILGEGPSIGSISGNGHLKFDVGQTTARMSVVIVADAIDEYDKTVPICFENLQNVKMALGQGSCVSVTILDDDAEPTVSFNPTSLTVSEAVGKVHGTLKLSSASAKSVSAFVMVSNDTNASTLDYEFSDVNVSFFDRTTLSYVTERQVELNITDDNEIEKLEKVVLEISSTTNCTAVEAAKKLTVNIIDNELPNPLLTVTRLDSNGNELPNRDVNEGDVDHNVTIHLHLSRPADKSATSLHYALAPTVVPIRIPGEPIIYPSYNSMIKPLVEGDILFELGAQDKEINITIIGDTINESDKSFTVELSEASNMKLYDTNSNVVALGENDYNVVFNIVDDDPMPVVSFKESTYTTAEGEQVQVKVLLSGKSYQTVEVNLTVHENSTATDSEVMYDDDYNLSTKHLVILATRPSANTANLMAIMDANISNNLVGESDETIILDMNSSKNARISSESNRTTITIEEEAVATPLSSNVFFNFKDDTHGYELWKSSGAVRDVSLFKDILEGTDSSSPSNFMRVSNHLLFFTVNDANYHTVLYKSDGTLANTTMVHSFGEDKVGSFVNVNGILYFICANTNQATDSATIELWSSDGTTTEKVKELKKVEYMEFEPNMVLSGNKLGILLGSEFMKYDIATTALETIEGLPNEAMLNNLVDLGGLFYFSVNSSEIWWSNNTTTQKSTLLDNENVYLDSMAILNHKLCYFVTPNNDNTQHILFRLNNGVVETVGTSNRAISRLKVLGDKMYWTTEGSVFVSDGTSIVTLKTFINGDYIQFLEDSIHNELFFAKSHYDNVTHITTHSLWKTDGTAGGTVNLTP